MNVPFPLLFPRFVDPSWFSADSPCDEDAELTNMEQAHQQWLNSIGQQYMKRPPLGKVDPEPLEEEAESDEEEEEEVNDESDESEESHDEDEEEELRAYSPLSNNNILEPEALEDPNENPENNNNPDQGALWPIQ
ncbi:anaphase-promoting complex subunit 15-like [Nymphalis io]|uniref:anaphase-promoting complex subunit 15-like n=1 Tax=Inachis io TaxID=171585 RepID=UPI002168A10A|nr:anaphase-promoting complex subunit 15-like [Nymphalis io]